MKVINVNNFHINIDDEDYDFITNFYDVSINKDGYPYCSPKKKYKHKQIGLYSKSLHKILIMPEGRGRGIVVDHIDGNKLNNQKCNLRICTHAENMRNRKTNTNSKQRFKGIFWKENMQKYEVKIYLDTKCTYIGAFTSEIAAANAYNYWAIKYHGDFARLNDVEFMEKEIWESYSARHNKSSMYRGVSKTYKGLYSAKIYHNKENVVVGEFETEYEAARAYDLKAIELKGVKAKVNFDYK
ncbi:HNH endonuclease [Paenibacillus sp. FSL K6-1122]|uniref:HNH endonuclease n=1 Tax=unclassified Paenibacillus TaxID=185978 RepID=UPI0030D5F8F2